MPSSSLLDPKGGILDPSQIVLDDLAKRPAKNDATPSCFQQLRAANPLTVSATAKGLIMSILSVQDRSQHSTETIFELPPILLAYAPRTRWQAIGVSKTLKGGV